MTIVINGKFTAQRTTGVQRVAHELVLAFNKKRHDQPLALVVPGATDIAQRTALGPCRIERSLSGMLGENLWEQLTLPWVTSASALLSLCNTGPLFKRRQVVMIHDMAIFDVPHCFTWKFRLWYRFVFSVLRFRAGHFLTVSEFSRARMIHHLKLSPHRISLVRPAVDHLDRITANTRILDRCGLKPQGFCLMVGSMDPRKNLMRCLAAIEQVECPPDFKFVLAGGSNANIFGAMPGGSTFTYNRTLQVGFVSDGELKALYENAACFVFPSLYEGFGLPPLEAMYCGCPVVTSRLASLPDVCGDAALYCDATSIDDIADKISLMLKDPVLRETCRARGRKRAREHGWSQAATQLEAALLQLAEIAPEKASASDAKARVAPLESATVSEHKLAQTTVPDGPRGG